MEIEQAYDKIIQNLDSNYEAGKVLHRLDNLMKLNNDGLKNL